LRTCLGKHFIKKLINTINLAIFTNGPDFSTAHSVHARQHPVRLAGVVQEISNISRKSMLPRYGGSYLASKLIEQLAQGLCILLPPQECQRAVPPPAFRHVYLPSLACGPAPCAAPLYRCHTTILPARTARRGAARQASLSPPPSAQEQRRRTRRENKQRGRSHGAAHRARPPRPCGHPDR